MSDTHMVTPFMLAIEHGNDSSFSRSVDPTATRRMKQIMAKKGWHDAALVDVEYALYEAGIGKCVSVYKYEVTT